MPAEKSAAAIERVTCQPNQFRFFGTAVSGHDPLFDNLLVANMSARRTEAVRFNNDNDTRVFG